MCPPVHLPTIHQGFQGLVQYGDRSCFNLGLLPIAAGNAGPFHTDTGSYDFAVFGQYRRHSQRAVSRKNTDLECRSDAHEASQKCQEGPLISRDLHDAWRESYRFRAKLRQRIGFARAIAHDVVLKALLKTENVARHGILPIEGG